MRAHEQGMPGPREPRGGGRGTNRLRRAVALLLAPALLGLTACGSAPDDDAGTREEPAAGRTAAEAPDEEGGAEGTPDHTHGPGTHTHAGTSADTLTAGAPLQSGVEAGSPGSVTVLALGDSARIIVEIRGVEAGSRYRAELAAGDCSEPGESLASLTPVMAGRSGTGSSQTTVAPGATAGHSHGAVRLSGASGTAACAPVHLPGSHEAASHDHQGG